MTVIHYKTKNDEIICGTKSKKINSTTKKGEVTCKKCLKKLETKVEKYAKKNKIKFIINKKFGPCIEIKEILLKLGDTFTSEIGLMILLSPLGMTSTSMKLANVGHFLSNKDINFLRKMFINLKNEHGDVSVLHVQEIFKNV